MGLFDKIFGTRPKDKGADTSQYFQTLTAYQPVFTSRTGSIYESELIRAAINVRATQISKLKAEVVGSSNPRLQTQLRKQPNSFQTWSQFLYRLSTILDVQNTAFIVPVYTDDALHVTGIYPVLPSRCEVVDVAGVPWIRYHFSNGDTAAEELSKVGIMTKFQYHDDFFGDGNSALNQTLDLINLQNQGIEEGVKNGATFRFMARLTNFAKPEDMAKERKRFNKETFQSDEGGILLFPNTYSDIQQIKAQPYTVDADQMDMIRTNVYNYYGVNDDVLQSKAYGDKWTAFYESQIEPFAIQFSDVTTKMLFSDRERAQGSMLMLTSNRLQYMSTAEKLNVSAQLADRGILNRDEVREIWNLPPLPNGEGQAYIIRGEYKDASDQINDKDTNNSQEGDNNDNN